MVQPVSANAAIHFRRDAHLTGTDRVYGRGMATRGFAQAMLRHPAIDALYCCAPSPRQFAEFRQMVGESASTKPVNWIPYSQVTALATPGCLFQPDPMIGELAWHRRALGSALFSLSGVTHTICSAGVMDAIGSLLTAPVEPWDALVCTSRAARCVVQHVAESYGEYLESRCGARPPLPIELPVIPLGVDCQQFADDTDDASLRESLRGELQIGRDDVAALFVGRLSYHAKAHPLPMYSALEAVAQRSSKRLHLLHFGWFANDALKRHFVDAARQACPSVTCRFLDDRQDLHRAVWRAADVFVCLSDNLQETFGLAPVEAMAAGLPLVVSDWNGYRDTVRDGIDGFLIPTVAPPSGAGDELASRYALGIDDYDKYVGHTSQTVAVDLPQCIAAMRSLVENVELRRSMGRQAQQRARSLFDWPVVIDAYQQMWSELASRRTHASNNGSTQPLPHPLRQDPYTAFAGYPSRILDSDCLLTLGPNAQPDRLQAVAAMPMNSFAAPLLCSVDEQRQMLDLISREVSATAGELVDALPAERAAAAYRTLGWLAKLDVLRIPGIAVKCPDASAEMCDH